MVEYTKGQELIARSLLDGPKTLMEIKKKVDMDATDLNEGLKQLIKVRVVERDGEKYNLIEEVTKALDQNQAFEAVFIIEGISPEKDILEKRMKVLEEKVRLHLKPKEIDIATPIQDENQWSMFIECTIGFKGIHELFNAIVSYGPSSVEVTKPNNVELDSYNLQRLASDLTSTIHYYTSIILNSSMVITKLKQENAQLKNDLAKTLQSETQKTSKNSTSKATKSD